MILSKMTLCNFRQFKGKQSIVFTDTYPCKKSDCITVIYGENGRGKTGIFRALMFGLYGDSILSQDEQTKKTDIKLVNRHMVELETEETVKAFVDISFYHNDQVYNIYRELFGCKNKEGKIVEQLGDARLNVQDQTGNTKSYDDLDEISTKINNVLSKDVREHFLFDGEKIARLTLANKEQQNEVSNGIKSLLNINDLEKSIKASTTLSRKVNNDLEAKSSGELQKTMESIRNIEDSITENEFKISDINDEILLCEKEKRDIDEKLNEYQEIKDLIDERSALEVEIIELEKTIDDIKFNCASQTHNISFSLVEQTLKSIYNIVDSQRQRGELPPLLRADLIESLLEKGECICGRELLSDSEPFKCLLEWLKKLPKGTETDASLDIWKELNLITANIPDHLREAKAYLHKYTDKEEEVNHYKERLDYIAYQIGNGERKDAANLENQRKIIEDKHIKLGSESLKLQDAIKESNNKLSELNKDRERLEKEEEKKNILVRRAKMIRTIKETLISVSDSFKHEIAKKLGNISTNIMKELLDEEGRKNLKRIIVAENYSLQMIDQWDEYFLANISAGQRQIMSIAFITALAKLAAGDGVFEMPLFMDTPFGRLSREHRVNLIKKIPTLSSQWILLATDTELRREEGQALINGNCLSNFYKLVVQEDGTTTIKKQELENIPSLLKATMETGNE